MDFGSLLHAAQKNENSVKEVKCYKSTFDPPKKEQKTKALSANIQKFLARKEEEERKKAVEAKKKKDELLALRSLDVKAKKRVSAMLKRTKAANKAAIEDAVDNENTAVTLGGLVQPDEDDYGYVSQGASAFHTKLMEKYTSTPSEEPKWSKKSLLKSSAADLNNTKDRVRMALLREEEEEMMPHKRKRKTKEEKLAGAESGCKSQSLSDYGETNELEEEKPEKPAKVCRPPPPPPPINFSELLKIAEKKQFEPVKIAPQVKEEDEDERPMTKKQRVEYMKEKEWRMRKEGKLPPLTASEQLRVQDQRNNRSRYSEERSRDQKSSHPAADSNSNQKYNRPSADKNRDKKNGQLFVGGQREQKGGRTSVYGNKDQVSGRFADQRIGQSSGEFRDQRNTRPPEASKNLKNDRSSGASNSSIPRIPKVTSVRKDEKLQHRIPKCNDISSSSNNRSVKLQGNSDGKACKERNRDVSGKLPIKSNHASSSSASGHGSANRNSVEQRKDIRNSDNNNSSSKNFNLSGYSKKLQETLLAKLQEKEKSGELSEAKKLCVPGAQNSKLLKNHDSGSFDLVRGPKPQSKAARSSDSKDKVKESSVGKQSVKPFTSPQGINKTVAGALSSKSQSLERSKSGHCIPSRDVKDVKMNPVTSSDVIQRQFPPPAVKPRQVQPGVKPQQFAPPGVKSQQFPLQGVKPRQFPPADVRMKPKPMPKRRIEDSDEEYDSELDDFIDDGQDEAEDYSKHIKEIFGYDKSRYKDIDNDECMESSFSQQLKEEFVSAKMGILEDLEDMEMEKRENEKKKKLMMMKKNRRL